MAPPVPEVSSSIFRMLGALAFVLALFFGAVWLFKNWQRISRTRSKARLRLVESQALGPRQALYVVAYAEQRFLIAASPGGVSLVSPLAAAPVEEAADAQPAPASFALLLQNALGRK